MRFPTRPVGDATLCKSATISAGPCKLVALLGDNSDADCRIQIYANAAGTGTALFDVGIFGGLPWSFIIPGGVVDLDACYVFASSTRTTLTAIAGNTVTIQGLLAA